MKTSCITHPAGDPWLAIHTWQMRACDDEPCAAMLLSLFEFYHNLKLSQHKQAKKLNEVAEAHGDVGQQYTGLLQWHSEEELQKHLLGIYGIKSIRNALQSLVSKGYISIHANPNKRYHFDRTRYILFHPEPVQDFIEQYQHPAFLPDASGKNASPSGKNASPSGKNAGPITVVSSETSSVIEDSPTPDELGTEGCAQGDDEAGIDQELDALRRQARARGLTLRAAGLSDRQISARQAQERQAQAQAAMAECCLCDTKGHLLFFDARHYSYTKECPHDLPKIEAYVASHAYTWPGAPPSAQPPDHGPPPAGCESSGDDAAREESAKPALDMGHPGSPTREPDVASVQSGATKGRAPSAPAGGAPDPPSSSAPTTFTPDPQWPAFCTRCGARTEHHDVGGHCAPPADHGPAP